MKRIGLFGGTFNPIHNGHLRAATAVRDGFGLDTVVLIPAAMPPHKSSAEIVCAGDRLEMVRLAVTPLQYIDVSDVEIHRSGPSYTIDTVRHFSGCYGADARLFFILGMDAFLELDTWKNFEALFFSIPMIVLGRPSGDPDSDRGKTVGEFLRNRISEGYQPGEDGCSFSHPGRQTVYLFPGEMMDLSSTAVRRRLGRGETVSDALPGPVEDFINMKGLYR